MKEERIIKARIIGMDVHFEIPLSELAMFLRVSNEIAQDEALSRTRHIPSPLGHTTRSRRAKPARVTSTIEERRDGIRKFMSDGRSHPLSEIRKAIGLGSHESAYAYTILLAWEKEGLAERRDSGWIYTKLPPDMRFPGDS